MRHLTDSLPICLIAVIVFAGPAAAATNVETLGDAYIVHDTQSVTWTIGAGDAALTLGLDPGKDFQVTKLTSPSGMTWLLGAQPGSSIIVNGSSLVFGSRAAGFQYVNVLTSNNGHTLQLDATFLIRESSLYVTRHFVVASGSPTFEVWTTYQSIGASAAVSDLNAFLLNIPAGPVRWLNGLQGDAAGIPHDSAFTLQQQTLTTGQTLSLGAQGRSSEQTVPWMAVDGTQDEFYAGLLWSGAWSLNVTRASTGLTVSLGLGTMTTTVGASPVDGPHAIFGVAEGTVADASAALRSYALEGLRNGRPFTPLVTYNTWFAYGTTIDEASMEAEMDGAAALGTELFVVDAGWYVGAGRADSGDFDSGLGSWQVDPARFPNGLKALTDYAHGLGMKFGVWVEPEAVSQALLGGSVDEHWMATSNGNYNSNSTALICLSGQAGRQWMVNQLTGLLDAVQPDYLKWDNNVWVNCNRAGHGHGPTDGNFAHVTALYHVLDALRQQYPSLIIENVSGGGNRLDYGMLRYTDVAWMDDDTAPSVHVRHNIEGLSAAFPPAYLLSFVTDHDTEPLHDAPDLSLYFRSRMEGALGLCFISASFGDADAAAMSREIGIYKTVRDTLSAAAGNLLSPQANADNGPEWDVLQATAPGTSALLLYAYQTDDGSTKVNVKPTGLQSDATYLVVSVDAGTLGSATGADLMANGIDVLESPASAAHILSLIVPQ